MLQQRYVNLLNEQANLETWQIEQAGHAVRLYFHNLRNRDASVRQKGAELELDENGCVGTNDLLSCIRESLRIQHYSYRAEKNCRLFLLRMKLKKCLRKHQGQRR